MKRLAFAAASAIALILSASFALSQTADKTHVDVPTIEPRPEDVGSLDGIMKAFYEVISGPAGQPRQWSRDRTLYIPDIRFVSMSVGKDGKPAAHTMSHQQFVDTSDKGLQQGGFYETEIHRNTERFGNIAAYRQHVRKQVESRWPGDRARH